VRRHRARHRRAAVGGFFVWLAQTVLTGIGFAAFILAGALTTFVLFVAVMTVVLWWLARDVRP
jgi:hypothetical protein